MNRKQAYKYVKMKFPSVVRIHQAKTRINIWHVSGTPLETMNAAQNVLKEYLCDCPDDLACLCGDRYVYPDDHAEVCDPKKVWIKPSTSVNV